MFWDLCKELEDDHRVRALLEELLATPGCAKVSKIIFFTGQRGVASNAPPIAKGLPPPVPGEARP
jgi:hypothetical protein